MELEQVKSLLPETVLSIAELIGFPATANLLKVLGGTTFPVGKGVRALGAARMRILKEAIGDENTAQDGEALIAFLTEKGHPALAMDPMM